jgi:hypothetical protein
MCPHCHNDGHDGGFAELDLIPCYADGYPKVAANGSVAFIFDGDTDVRWDSQRPQHAPPQYMCFACNKTFVTFALVPADAET